MTDVELRDYAEQCSKWCEANLPQPLWGSLDRDTFIHMFPSWLNSDESQGTGYYMDHNALRTYFDSEAWVAQDELSLVDLVYDFLRKFAVTWPEAFDRNAES